MRTEKSKQDGELNKHNLRDFIIALIEEKDITVKQLAKAIHCPISSIERIVMGMTFPSKKMLKECNLIKAVDFEAYKKLSESEKEKISETLGAVGSSVFGLGSITAVISSLGTAGLSASGISSGLAAMGTVIGGGMAYGVVVAATIPLAAGAAGYGAVKGIKTLIGKHKLDAEKIDATWEVKK